jgi:mRNA interferase RelE/StbE
MTYLVQFTAGAVRQIKRIPRPVQSRVLDAIADLGGQPRPRGSRKLAGEEVAWRIRVSDYRVIYEILDTSLTVTVVRAGHRREIDDR